MKHFSLTFAAAALAGLAGAQAIGTAEIVAEGHITGPDSYRAADVAKAPNGDYIFVADLDNGVETKLLVTRTSPGGTPIWTRQFARPGGPGDVFAWKTAIAGDGKIYIVASIEGTASLRDYWYLELNGVGIKLNERVVDHYDNDYTVGDLQVASDGSVYFIGSGLDESQPRLVKMDASLNTLWFYDLGSASATVRQDPGTLDIGPDGSVVASSTIHDGTQLDVQFVKLTSTGAFVYEKVLGDATRDDDRPKVMIGDDGSAYFTYTRSSMTASEEVRLSKYSDTGVFQWNKAEVAYSESLFVKSPITGFAFVAVQRDAPGTMRAFGFDDAGTVTWSRTLTRPNIDFHSLSNFVVDDDGYLTVLSYTSETGRPDGDWLVTSLSRAGVPLYEWKWDTGVGNYDIPTGVAAASLGEVVATGFTFINNQADMDTFQIRPILLIRPDSATIRLGRLNSGTLASLYSDDNDYYEMCKFIVPNQTVAPVNVEFDAVVPAEYPIRTIAFDTAVKANTPGLQQDTQLWNWLNNSWDPSVYTNLNLAEVKTRVDGLPDPNVDGTTRRVRARIRVKPVGPVTVNLWCVQIDQVGWRIRP